MDHQPLIAKLGGEENVNKAVVRFYEHVLADPTVNHFFKNTDMAHQTKQQQAFLTMAFGGPNHYHGKDMKAAHAGMGITGAQFDSIVNHLANTLKEFGVSAEVLGEVGAVAESTRADIVEA